MTNYPQEKIKPYNEEERKAVQVEKMFDNIAPAYDTLNHTLSWGIDKCWRRKAINWLKPFRPRRMWECSNRYRRFCHSGLPGFTSGRTDRYRYFGRNDERGKRKVRQAGLDRQISFAKEDCTALSFPDKRFDAITVAFGVRNFENLDKGLPGNVPCAG